MSIFPTKVLLATDGSEEAQLAAQTTADLADKTGSELHVIYTVPVPVAIDPFGVETTSKIAEETARQRAQQFLGEQVERIEAQGGSVAQAHVKLGRPDEEIINLAEE